MPTEKTSKYLTSEVQLHRLVGAEQFSAEDIYQAMSSGTKFNFEPIVERGFDVMFPFDTGSLDISQKSWSDVRDEAALAVAIYEALIPARQASLEYLVDPGIWAWIALTQVPEYVVNRWCGGFVRPGVPVNSKSCSYFLSGHSIQKQTRCAPRRLFIAANTSNRAKGDFSQTERLLTNTDIYSATFERQLGMDAELAVELAQQFVGTGREIYRPGFKLVGVLLSTMALEYLDLPAKKALVLEAFNAVSSEIVSSK